MRFFGSSGSSASTASPARSINLVKDPDGRPAFDLSKVRDAGHLDLAKRADKAGVALSKRGLSGVRARSVMLLDHSASMSSDYANRKVQTLVARVLGYDLQIDIKGVVPVIPFDHRVLPTVNVTVDNHHDVVDRQIWRGPHDMGTTRLHEALRVVRDMATTTDAPLFCTVVTDGNPDSKPATTDIVVDLARYPVFLKFIAIREVPYLQELDELPADRRLVDNVDAKFFNDPAAASDLEFAEALADEWDTWIAAARRAGILAGV